MLHLDIQILWLHLEEALWWIASVHIASYKVPLPPNFQPGPFPSSYGYLKRHTEERYVCYCAMKLWDAFISLMSLCSMTISIIGFSATSNANDPNVPWIKHLLDKQHVDASWIEDLTHSCVADFSIDVGRVGTLIDVAIFNMPTIADAMVKANVPIWFYWRTRDSGPAKHHKGVHRFQPTQEEIERGMSAAKQEEDATRFRLPHGSRQKPGEPWQAYFERMSEAQEEHLLHESTDQKSRREA